MTEKRLDYERSSFRESMVEHAFIADLQQEAWFRHQTTIEILRPEVDDSGYDIVAWFNGVVRYIQLKASRADGRAVGQNVNIKLADKPGGCVIWLRYRDNGDFRVSFEYLFFEDMGSLEQRRSARHTKGNAQGFKAERPRIRVVGKAAFEPVASAEELMTRLFGKHGG